MTALLGKNNMKILNIFKREKFPVKTFMVVSILSFLALMFLWTVFIVLIFPPRQMQNNSATSDKLYLNKDYNNSDPFVTKVPNLKDILRGPIISDNDPSLGNKDAKVVIVEFSDFQCKYCQEQENILKSVVNEYKDKVRLIWKDLPDPNVKSDSFRSAVAGRCAEAQNHFWDYHDLLFNNTDYSDNAFISLAEKLNLNQDTFRSCLQGNQMIRRVQDNISEADGLQISGIPFIYVNDQEVFGQINQKDLENIINTELKKIGS